MLDNKGGSNRRHSTAPHHLDPPSLEPFQQPLWMTPISINPATKRDSSTRATLEKDKFEGAYSSFWPLPPFFLLSLSLSFTPPHSSFFFTSVRLLKNSRTRGELIHPRPRRTARFRPRFIGVSRIYPRRHRLGPVFFVRGTPAFSGRFNPWGVREPREK